MGVVFLEMITIFVGNDIEIMRIFFFQTHGTEVDCIRENISRLDDYSIEPQRLACKPDGLLLQSIEGVVQMDPHKRLHAALLVENKLSARGG